MFTVQDWGTNMLEDYQLWLLPAGSDFNFYVSLSHTWPAFRATVERRLTHGRPGRPARFKLCTFVSELDYSYFWFSPFMDLVERQHTPRCLIEIQDTAPTKWRWRLPVHPSDPWSIRTLWLACQVSIHDYEHSDRIILDALLHEIKDSLLPEQAEKFLI